MTGKTEEIVQWPNIFIYGLTENERRILDKSLPAKVVEVSDITGVATDIVTRTDFAVIINPENIADDELEFFSDFYKGIDAIETIVFTKSKEGLKDKFPDVKTVIYNDEAEMENGLKYELMQALNKTNRIDSYYSTLSQAIVILFAIRNKPYITTKELSLKIERTPRTVQRYIETLRCAGEWIEYDQKKKGWYLIEGKSILLDEL